jgi:hypothetical protein
MDSLPTPNDKHNNAMVLDQNFGTNFESIVPIGIISVDATITFEQYSYSYKDKHK